MVENICDLVSQRFVARSAIVKLTSLSLFRDTVSTFSRTATSWQHIHTRSHTSTLNEKTCVTDHALLWADRKTFVVPASNDSFRALGFGEVAIFFERFCSCR
jgi:hypothetical protein